MSEDVFDGVRDAAVSSPSHADGDVGRQHSPAVITMPSCSNSEFMGRLLAGAAPSSYGWVCAFTGDPGTPDTGKWYGMPWVDNDRCRAQVDAWGPENTYFCVSELREVEGLGGRRKVNFVRLRALPIDDAVAAGILGMPSWTLGTSPGKDQTGVFIDPTDPDAADPALADAVMQELHRRKLLGDTSGNNLVRYVRLPVGTNGKPRDTGPFQHRLDIWNPEQVLTLADACAVFGIDLDELRPKAKAVASDMVLLGEGQDKLMAEAMQRIVTGEEYHDSINRIAASMAASGAHPGTQVNLLRALMSAAQAPRDQRWQDRYNDIPRAVATGSRKYQVEPLAAPGEPEARAPLLTRVGDDIDAVKPILWLVRNWAEAACLSMMFGPPNIGKSFIAYDMACCVATGTPWCGNDVMQGPVVVVVGEGGAGIKRRFKAWSIENKVDLKGAPLYLTTRAVPILDRVRALELVAEIDAVVVAAGGITPVLIVIDTLARNFGGDGDENSAKDASAFIEAVSELLCRRYCAHVQIIHHSGVAGGRARGSTAFKGAMDQEFSVEAVASGKIIKLEATKMKDAEKPPPKDFKIKTVLLGRTEDDEPITSAVVESVTSELDDVIFVGDDRNITVGHVLDLRDGEFSPSQQQIVRDLGVTKRQSMTISGRLKVRRLVEDMSGSNARKKLTTKAMQLLSRAGKLVGDGLESPEDSE